MIELSTKQKAIISTVVIATAFASGRYSVPEKVKIVTQTVTVAQKSDDLSINKDKKTHRTVTKTTVVKPDGEKVSTIVATDDDQTNNHSDNKQVDLTSTSTSKDSEIVKGSDKVTISALGGYDFLHNQTVFGGSITKPIFGPITLGIFGLSNGTAGLSCGLTF